MAVSSLAVQTTADYFESIYADAGGDSARIPWADGRPHQALVNWLNAVAPSLVRCGARVCAVGCGLGDDARELMHRGYEVTAFDCSRTAVAWAKSLDPANARCYCVADLFQVPPRWKHRFDLVVEVNTIHALTPEMQEPALKSIADLVSPHGYLLAITRGAEAPPAPEDGPPWPLTYEQLVDYAARANLHPVEHVAVFDDEEDPPVQRMRGLFKRR